MAVAGDAAVRGGVRDVRRAARLVRDRTDGGVLSVSEGTRTRGVGRVPAQQRQDARGRRAEAAGEAHTIGVVERFSASGRRASVKDDSLYGWFAVRPEGAGDSGMRMLPASAYSQSATTY